MGATTAALERAYVTAAGEMLGLPCVFLEPGWLTVTAYDAQFHVHLDPEDPGLCRVAVSSAWPPDTDAVEATAAAAHLNRVCKGVKLTLGRRDPTVVLSSETIVGPAGEAPAPAHLAVVLDRALLDLTRARRAFPGEVALARLAARCGDQALTETMGAG